jgi:hypothetical protein
MAIRATDDEELATQLWGDDKEWNDERKQFVPVEKEVKSSPGNSTERSSDPTTSSNDKTGSSPRPTAPTTVQPSKQTDKGGGTAPSTAGSGKAKP